MHSRFKSALCAEGSLLFEQNNLCNVGNTDRAEDKVDTRLLIFFHHSV